MSLCLGFLTEMGVMKATTLRAAEEYSARWAQPLEQSIRSH